MAWTDPATRNQIDALWSMMSWGTGPREERVKKFKWLEEELKPNRKDMSTELNRVRELKIANNLTEENAWTGEIWGRYEKK